MKRIVKRSSKRVDIADLALTKQNVRDRTIAKAVVRLREYKLVADKALDPIKEIEPVGVPVMGEAKVVELAAPTPEPFVFVAPPESAERREAAEGPDIGPAPEEIAKLAEEIIHDVQVPPADESVPALAVSPDPAPLEMVPEPEVEAKTPGLISRALSAVAAPFKAVWNWMVG